MLLFDFQSVLRRRAGLQHPDARAHAQGSQASRQLPPAPLPRPWCRELPQSAPRSARRPALRRLRGTRSFRRVRAASSRASSRAETSRAAESALRISRSTLSASARILLSGNEPVVGFALGCLGGVEISVRSALRCSREFRWRFFEGRRARSWFRPRAARSLLICRPARSSRSRQDARSVADRGHADAHAPRVRARYRRCRLSRRCRPHGHWSTRVRTAFSAPSAFRDRPARAQATSRFPRCSRFDFALVCKEARARFGKRRKTRLMFDRLRARHRRAHGVPRR
jgi:hypothetical protein